LTDSKILDEKPVIKEDIINDNDSAFEDAEEEVIQKPKNPPVFNKPISQEGYK